MEFARTREAPGGSGTAAEATKATEATEATEATRAGEATAETVTLIIGMRAHRNTDGVRMSFFVTGKRVGVDFGLLSADSRPLTERQLRAVLEPDAWRRTATEYRDLVDQPPLRPRPGALRPAPRPAAGAAPPAAGQGP